MLEIRKSQARGHVNHGWLDTFHTFSFADYHDPAHMGFRTLRVINEDRVKPGRGFGTHGHRDMEILTWILAGALEHRDSMGNGDVIRPGDVQRMSAGTGVTHSEFNPSESESVHLLQIWILPEREGLTPSYEQRHFAASEREGRLRLVASGDAREGSVRIQQDADLYTALLEPGTQVTHALRPGRHAWVQVARGALMLNGTPLEAGDGAALSDEPRVELRATQPSEVLVFDLG
jgi:hypothetical protein